MRIAKTAALILVLVFLMSPTWSPAQDLSFYNSAEAVRQAYLEKLLAEPGVYGVGLTLSDGEAAIVVLVNPETRGPKLPERIDGVPVVVDRVAPPILYDGGQGCWNDPPGGGCHTERLDRPVPMGVSTQNGANGSGPGTLGVKACRHSTGHIGYMTCNHVATESGNPQSQACSDDLFQFHPTRNDADRIVLGRTEEVAPLSSSQVNTIDAAFVHSFDLVVSPDLHHLGPAPQQTTAPVPGVDVRKSGRRTGETFGRIEYINITLNGSASVTYGCGLGDLEFEGVFRVADPNGIFAAAGDSGAAIVSDGGLVGYVFTGDPSPIPAFTYGLPMQPALDALGLTLDLGQCPDVAAIQVTCGDDPMPIGGELDFGSTQLAELPTDRQCSVCNYGSQTLVVDNPNGLVSGTGFSQAPFPGQLTPGACATLDIQFDVGTAGDYPGSVLIQSNNQDGTYVFNLFATAAPNPFIDIVTPVGGSLFGLYDRIDILWNHHLAGPFGIELSVNGGSTFGYGIGQSSLPYYSWFPYHVGVPSTDQAVILVYDLDDPTISDVSEVFEIDVDSPTAAFYWIGPVLPRRNISRTPTIKVWVEDGESGPDQNPSTGVRFYLDPDAATVPTNQVYPTAIHWGTVGASREGFTATFDFDSGFPGSYYTLKAVVSDLAGNEVEATVRISFPILS